MLALSLWQTTMSLHEAIQSHCSYSVMKSCWESEPENRPQFSELVLTISSILESTAGYLELAMSLQNVKSDYESGDPRVDSEPGSDDHDFTHQTDK